MAHEYQIPFREWRRLTRRALGAQQHGYFEVAGLFAANRQHVIRLFFMENQSVKPGEFELSWEEIGRVRKEIRAGGFRYLGVFHSHPIGFAVPGPQDIRRSRVNAILLVYEVFGTNAKLWRIVGPNRRKRAKELPLDIERRRLTRN
jgi:proteasome lid subunit RPN8/RPN11